MNKNALVHVVYSVKLAILVLVNSGDLHSTPLYLQVIFQVRVVQPHSRAPPKLSAICTRHVNQLIDQGRCTSRNLPAPLWHSLRLQKT